MQIARTKYQLIMKWCIQLTDVCLVEPCARTIDVLFDSFSLVIPKSQHKMPNEITFLHSNLECTNLIVLLFNDAIATRIPLSGGGASGFQQIIPIIRFTVFSFYWRIISRRFSFASAQIKITETLKIAICFYNQLLASIVLVLVPSYAA